VDDNELKYMALNMYANWIETHDVIISARDAVASGEQKKVRALDVNQMKMVIRLRELADEAFKGK
jgi:hypothetical protein